jgi:putative ABC transport system permease protein
MHSVVSVAWYQLSHQRMKLLAAAAGVTVAVMLMLVQMGIRQGALDNSVAFARRLQSDLIVISPRTRTIFESSPFPRRLLYRLRADPEVHQLGVVYAALARWRDPWQFKETPILIYGLEPADGMVNLPGLEHHGDAMRWTDRAVFDGMSRHYYGPVASTLNQGQRVSAEVNGRRLHVVGQVMVGASLSQDGSLFLTPANFLRLFPARTVGAVDIGLVQLDDDADPNAACLRLQSLLGSEAKIITRGDLIDAEIAFVRTVRPVDFIFGLGTIVGFFIGFVVIYQILYTEVTNHLPQLATLKAVGFTDGYLFQLVGCQAIMLALLGYIPGFFLAMGLYEVASAQIQMPFEMTAARAVGVFLATLLMGLFSAMIAVRKAWKADPAEVF